MKHATCSDPVPRPPAYCPSSTGSIVIENLVIKYAPDLPAVLHYVSFAPTAGERAGLWDA